MQGLVQIYCGDGKGKTTAATGQAIRAAGTGLNVVFVRFIKTDHSGELRILNAIPEITMIPLRKNFKFVFRMTEEEKKEAAALCTEMMEEAFAVAYEKAAEKDTVLVMDEIIATSNHGFVPMDRLVSLITNRPSNLEVVMTGRNPADVLVELADYVSEVKKIKHPYEKGIVARKGIEF